MTFLFISLSLYFVQMSAQTPRQKKEAADLVYAQAINAYKQGKIQDAIDQFTAFLNMRPNYINAEFNIAQLSAALGKTDISYRYLNKLAAYGMNLNPANFEDPDLQKIPAQQLAEIKSKFVLNQELKGDAEIVFQLDERDLITESVVIDQRNGDSYISSVRKRKIIRKKKNGKFEDFSAESDNLWAVFSLKISPDGRYLWASSSATREMLNADTNLTDQTAMFRYNLKTAKLDKRFSLPSDHKAHIWGDFVFAADGLLYISDSVDNTIYVLNPESGEFKKLLNSFYFSSLQGLVFNEKETLLFVADYSEGIYAID
ncbi:MAG: hypothetical protein KDD94_14750, partial [Calditrichaeota bacterium]|nr:hypothetical protein [Calditrichota bacterium]